MKRYIFFLTVILICLNAEAQRVIEKPKYGFSTAPYVKIVRIELDSSATVFHFDVMFGSGNWIVIPSRTYIRPAETYRKLYIKEAEGITIDKKFYMPDSGRVSYKLYFPPLDESVEVIDYGEDGGTWFIFQIELAAKKWIALLSVSPLLNDQTPRRNKYHRKV